MDDSVTLKVDGADTGVLGVLYMVVTGGDRPSKCKGAGGGGSRQGRVGGRRREGYVGDDRKELTAWDIT